MLRTLFRWSLRKKPKQGADRRSEPRYPAFREISIVRCSNTPADWAVERVMMRELSVQGIGLSAPFRMKVGEQFLANMGLNAAPLLLYTVRNCSRDGSGGYRVGARFSRVASESLADASLPAYDGASESSESVA